MPVPADELIAPYERACEARGHAALAIDAPTVNAIRARTAELTMQRQAVPVGGSLELDFQTPM